MAAWFVSWLGCRVHPSIQVIRGVPKTESFDARERLQMISFVNDLSRYVGACERIVQTPVPLSYARHTSRFLTLWMWSLPLSLVGINGYYSVVVIGFMSWALFGILEIGLQIEDPFPKQLRLETLTRGIVDSVQNTVQNMPGGSFTRSPVVPIGSTITSVVGASI